MNIVDTLIALTAYGSEAHTRDRSASATGLRRVASKIYGTGSDFRPAMLGFKSLGHFHVTS